MTKNVKNLYYNSKKTFVVAEIGINHNGDMSLAKETIIAAAEAGADSVKFQNYKTDDFITDKNLILEYQSNGKNIKESQYKLFKRCELSFEQLLELKELCDFKGIVFHSTPTSIEGIEDLKKIGCNILKNGSDFLTNLRLIKAMGETGLLTVLSTGMATLSEIEDAVYTFRDTGNKKLLLLHCTSSYPTKPDEVNLSRINTLREKFNVDVGFSDHTKGISAAVGSIFFGARWIEKHFTLDQKLLGPDHWFSLDPEELNYLINSIRHTEKIIGNGEIAPTPGELKSRKEFRLSCVAARDLKPGTHISSNDIDFQRPGDGMPPLYEKYLLGKKINHFIKKGEKFENKHFDG